MTVNTEILSNVSVSIHHWERLREPTSRRKYFLFYDPEVYNPDGLAPLLWACGEAAWWRRLLASRQQKQSRIEHSPRAVAYFLQGDSPPPPPSQAPAVPCGRGTNSQHMNVGIYFSSKPQHSSCVTGETQRTQLSGNSVRSH